MPFLSSVSGSRGGGIWRIVGLPRITIDSPTNFNESRATFNATVVPNGAPTNVKFQFSTNGTTWTDSGTISNVFGLSQAANHTHTGLSVGTSYYVRAIATNVAGSTTSDTTTFTTWSLKTYTKTTSGSFSVEIPSIPGVAPTIYEMLIYGGGGGANYAGGGGGGYRIASSKTSSSTGTQTISGTIGAGGAGGNGGGGFGGATSGGTSTLTVGNTTYTATGGGAGQHPGNVGAPSGSGGSSGSGDNWARGGGGNAYGYYYFTGNYEQKIVDYVYVCTHTDKFGTCTGGYYDYNQPIYGNDTTKPIYAWSGSYYAGGGGGGTDATGAGASGHTTASQVGGAGGAGGGAYGLRGGNGGGGRGTQGVGSNGSVAGGSGPIVGTGGQGWYGAGVAGGVTFKYYGP